jgi:thioredoxin-related protein
MIAHQSLKSSSEIITPIKKIMIQIVPTQNNGYFCNQLRKSLKHQIHKYFSLTLLDSFEMMHLDYF